MGGIMTLQGSTQTLHSSKLQVEEPSTPRVQKETEKNVVDYASSWRKSQHWHKERIVAIVFSIGFSQQLENVILQK